MELREQVQDLLSKTNGDYESTASKDWRLIEDEFHRGYVYGVQEVRMVLKGILKEMLDDDE